MKVTTQTRQSRVDAPPLDRIFMELGWGDRRKRDAANALIAHVAAIARESSAGPFPEQSLGGGIERAIAEGEQWKRRELIRPDMLGPDEAAAMAGISRQALDLRRRKNQALALTHVKRGYRYPSWQFSDRLAGLMPRLLPRLRGMDAWAQYLLLTEAEPLLGGKAIAEVLGTGDTRQAERALDLLAKEALESTVAGPDRRR